MEGHTDTNEGRPAVVTAAAVFLFMEAEIFCLGSLSMLVGGVGELGLLALVLIAMGLGLALLAAGVRLVRRLDSRGRLSALAAATLLVLVQALAMAAFEGSPWSFIPIALSAGLLVLLLQRGGAFDASAAGQAGVDGEPKNAGAAAAGGASRDIPMLIGMATVFLGATLAIVYLNYLFLRWLIELF